MMRIEPHVLNQIAEENGWIHATGRLAGTINARAMAEGLGVSASTITRAYDSGALGATLLSKLRKVTERPLDSIVSFETVSEAA